MEINLDDLNRILTDGRLAVSLAGAICIHCNVVSRTIESAAEHDASCEKHPMAARIAELESALAEAREAFGHSESERCELRAVLRDTIEALGGVAAPGVSVQFLKLAPQAAAAVKKQLAEALEDSKRRRVALEEVLDGLGALTKPHELDGCGIGIKRALEIIALSKARP